MEGCAGKVNRQGGRFLMALNFTWLEWCLAENPRMHSLQEAVDLMLENVLLMASVSVAVENAMGGECWTMMAADLPVSSLADQAHLAKVVSAGNRIL